MKVLLILYTFTISFLLAAEGDNAVETLKPYTVEALAASDPAPVVGGISHSAFDMMLKKHVSSTGKVDYESFKSDPNFARYIGMLQAADPYSGWSSKEQKAYWMNAYNAFTIKLILDNYPVKSIKDISKPWDKKFIVINGVNYSLNQIENDILRPIFKDPRIHFGINCAALSCPKLHNAAFTAENVNSKLETLTKAFVNNASFNEISASSIKVSSIFDWYSVDFTTGQTLIEWLNKYSKTTINAGATLSYTNYNWDLNKK